MRKTVTPIIAIILLVLMTIGAVSIAFFWVSNVQAGLQESVGSNIESGSGADCNRLQIISMRGDEVTVNNVGCETINNVTLIIDGVLYNVGLDNPLSPGSASTISFSSLSQGEDHCITIVLSNGQTTTQCSTANDNTQDSGYSPQCTVPADCDDSNVCTTDDCVNGACTNTQVSDGQVAGCTGDYACVSGECVESCGDGYCQEWESFDSCSDCETWPMFRHDPRNTAYSSQITSPNQTGTFEVRDFGLMKSPPIISDIDDDDKLDIVVSDSALNIYVYYGENNTVKWSNTTADSSRFGIDEETGDVFSSYYEYDMGTPGPSYGFEGDGTPKWYYSETMFTFPTIVDVDSDSETEVVFVDYNKNVRSLNADTGSVEWTYDIPNGEFVRENPVAVGDLDGDGTNEVVFGSYGSKVYVLHGNNGTLKWTYSIDSNAWTSPTLADLNDDGDLEIIASSFSGTLYSLFENGTLMWSYSVGSRMENAAVADINNDGIPEIVFPRYLSPYNMIAVYGNNGTVFWTHTETDYHTLSPPIIGDADGDGIKDVIYTKKDVSTDTCTSLTILYGTDGTQQHNEELTCVGYDEIVTYGPALADIDDDGVVEIVTTSRMTSPV